MGFLKHLRSKSRIKDESSSTSIYRPPPAPVSRPARYGRDFTQRLSDDVLERIFADICPHTQDQTFEPSEHSSVGDGCMLCDLRDLAKTAQTCRKWYRVAQNML